MEKTRIASIDIGTNTILMMIADKFPDGEINVIEDQHALARLGEDLSKNNKIKKTAINRAIDILQRYKILINALKVNQIRAVATSAMRDASNADDVIKLFENILESEVRIISGEQEAFFSFIGTIESELPSIVVDIGGGSTEIIYGENRHIISAKSINIGAVKITEKFFASQPPDLKQILNAEQFIIHALEQNLQFNLFKRFYGVGGTFTTIASISRNQYDFERDKISNTELSFSDFIEVYNILKSSSIDEIVNKYKVHPMRADVITAGTLIALKTLEYFQAEKCTINSYGLRYGLIIVDEF